jgi:hypothetical protein
MLKFVALPALVKGIYFPQRCKRRRASESSVKGAVVVFYFEPLTTQNLKFSGVPDVLGRSSKSEAQRVNNTAK